MNPISPIRPATLPAARTETPPMPPPEPTPPAPNPSLRIEPSLGVVVYEVRDPVAKVVRSVPTERELEAYRAAALRGGEAPASSSGQQPQPPRREAE